MMVDCIELDVLDVVLGVLLSSGRKEVTKGGNSGNFV